MTIGTVEYTAWLMLSMATGLAVGAFYFAGLWWTVRRLPGSRKPGILALSSYCVRVAVTLAAFYTVMNGQWENPAACMLGFIVARSLVTRRLGPTQSASEMLASGAERRT